MNIFLLKGLLESFVKFLIELSINDRTRALEILEETCQEFQKEIDKE